MLAAPSAEAKPREMPQDATANRFSDYEVAKGIANGQDSAESDSSEDSRVPFRLVYTQSDNFLLIMIVGDIG